MHNQIHNYEYPIKKKKKGGKQTNIHVRIFSFSHPIPIPIPIHPYKHILTHSRIQTNPLKPISTTTHPPLTHPDPAPAEGECRECRPTPPPEGEEGAGEGEEGVRVRGEGRAGVLHTHPVLGRGGYLFRHFFLSFSLSQLTCVCVCVDRGCS